MNCSSCTVFLHYVIYSKSKKNILVLTCDVINIATGYSKVASFYIDLKKLYLS